jgi:hypothetical protein
MNDATEMPRLQWQRVETLYHPDGGDWSKTKHEAVATWSTPLGPGRYRIWRVDSWNGGYFTVVRLKPSNGTFLGHPKKFSGYALPVAVTTMAAATAAAEADNTRLCSATHKTGTRRR